MTTTSPGIRTTIERGSTGRSSPSPQFRAAAGTPRRGQVRFVSVPDRMCFAIEGDAEPGGPDFQSAIDTLFSTAYPLHFLLRERGIESVVGHLECLFERRDGSPSWNVDDEAFGPGAWRWTLAIAIPEAATDDDIGAAIGSAGNTIPQAQLRGIQVMTLREGPVVEALHVGPYDTEPETLARMLQAARAEGLEARGHHHEIYLNDPHEVGPARTRTILRLPVALAGRSRPIRPGEAPRR